MNRIKEDKLNNKEIIYLNIIKIFACFMVIINHTNDPYTVISKLTSLSPDIISQYISKLNAKTL